MNERFFREAVPWIDRRTIAIFAVSDSDIPVAHGTGVLLQVADQRFVVTAAHSLDVWRELKLVVPVGDKVGINLTCSPADITCDRREADFALIPLRSEMWEQLKRSKECVRLADVDATGDEPHQGIHAVYGYPVELAKRDEGGLNATAVYYPTTLTTLSDVDPGLSIALEIHPEMVDADGDRARLPDLHGISGCGIWRLHLKGENPDEWTLDRIRLVGIEHTVKPGKWIRGVRSRHVVAGIASRFPELEASVALIGVSLIKNTAPRP